MFTQRSGSKYHSKTTQVDGISYHSKLEAGYAQELNLRVRAKDIKSWERQVRLSLKVNGTVVTSYYIDFVVLHNDGSREYVECKGLEMDIWKLKWKILEATFDQDFRQHPDDRLTVVKQVSMRNWRGR